MRVHPFRVCCLGELANQNVGRRQAFTGSFCKYCHRRRSLTLTLLLLLLLFVQLEGELRPLLSHADLVSRRDAHVAALKQLGLE